IAVDGREAAFEREPYQDVVWVIPAEPLLPQREVNLDFAYEGRIDDWQYRENADAKRSYWERLAFVEADRLFLPNYYGWYPVPGNQRVAELEQIYLGSASRTIKTEYIVHT